METVLSRARKAKHANAILRQARRYHAQNRARCCADMKRRHELARPKSSRVEGYIFELKKRLLVDRETMAELVRCFERHHGKMPGTRASCMRGVASLAPKTLVSNALQTRRLMAGALLKSVRSVVKITLDSVDDFGSGLHSIHSKPYFYEAAYMHDVDRPQTLCVDECVRPEGCEDADVRSWGCSDKCKPPSESEVSSILELRQSFDGSMYKLEGATLSYACWWRELVPVKENKWPHKPSPQRAKQASPDQILDEFLARGCRCASKCYEQFDRAEYVRRRDEAHQLTRDELDMVVLGQIMACICMGSVVGPSHHHAPTQRQRTRTNVFYHLGKKIYRSTFLVLHGIGKVARIEKNLNHDCKLPNLCTL